MKKARKLKSTIIVKHKGEWCEVVAISHWGKNWMINTDGEDFVVGDTWQGLFRVTRSEFSALIGGQGTT